MVVNVEVDIGIEVGEEAARLDEDAIVDDDEDELGRELDIDVEEVVGRMEALSSKVDVGGKTELEEVDPPAEVARLDADVMMEVECEEDGWEAAWDDGSAGEVVLLVECIDIVVVSVLVEIEEAAVFRALDDGNRKVELDDCDASEEVEL